MSIVANINILYCLREIKQTNTTCLREIQCDKWQTYGRLDDIYHGTTKATLLLSPTATGPATTDCPTGTGQTVTITNRFPEMFLF